MTDRNDNTLRSIICPHCKYTIQIPSVRVFAEQQLIFVRCERCDKGITKRQIDDAYKEYVNADDKR